MLMRKMMLALLFAISKASSYGAFAQEPGNPESGFAYARQACAQCHAIREGNNSSPNPQAPSFEQTANSAGMTGISLAATLHSVHEHMPNFPLSANQRDNLIAYILSLKHDR